MVFGFRFKVQNTPAINHEVQYAASVNLRVQHTHNNWQQGTHLRSAHVWFATLTLPHIGSAPAGPCARRYASDELHCREVANLYDR